MARRRAVLVVAAATFAFGFACVRAYAATPLTINTTSVAFGAVKSATRARPWQ